MATRLSTETIVSVLIPAHERKEFLRAAISSARAQDYPPSAYEVVVVHDGQDAKLWLPRSDREHPVLRVEVIEQGGQGAAVNRAFALSHGDYVTVLQDDDMILPHKVRVLAAALDADPNLGGVYSLPQYVEADGATPRRTPPQLREYLCRFPRVTALTVAHHGLCIHGMATMVRRTAWVETGPWDTTLRAGEEWDWHLRFLLSGHVLGAVDEVTSRYRYHPAQKSNRHQRGQAVRRGILHTIRVRYRPAFAALLAADVDGVPI